MTVAEVGKLIEKIFPPFSFLWHCDEIMSNTTHAANHKQFLKVGEVATLLNVKPRTIYEMVAQNRIPYRKPPGSNILRFDLDEIIAWTKAGNNK